MSAWHQGLQSETTVYTHTHTVPAKGYSHSLQTETLITSTQWITSPLLLISVCVSVLQCGGCVCSSPYSSLHHTPSNPATHNSKQHAVGFSRNLIYLEGLDIINLIGGIHWGTMEENCILADMWVPFKQSYFAGLCHLYKGTVDSDIRAKRPIYCIM